MALLELLELLWGVLNLAEAVYYVGRGVWWLLRMLGALVVWLATGVYRGGRAVVRVVRPRAPEWWEL